ncbi:MAG: enoyl-CoA hydratase/isomerase family protein [Rubrivivax sp.]
MLNRQRDGAALTLTLARPERGNALAPALVEALLDAVQAASADATLHTLVLRAEGRHFCTGLDLSDLDRTQDADWLWRLVRIETLLDALWRCPLATVALAQGRAWGAGADLFAACERRIAAPDASFRFPGAQFGIVLGTRRLAERIGSDAARALVTGGGTLDAPQALAAGLATAIGSDVDGPAPAVDAPTAAAIRAATRRDAPDADLAALVRSAAQPGLVERMRAYRERSTRRS